MRLISFWDMFTHTLRTQKIFPTRPHKRACIETHACTRETHMEINDMCVHTRVYARMQQRSLVCTWGEGMLGQRIGGQDGVRREGNGRGGWVADSVLQVCVTTPPSHSPPTYPSPPPLPPPPPSPAAQQPQQEPLQPEERVLPASGGTPAVRRRWGD